jgi:hypothetical protein
MSVVVHVQKIEQRCATVGQPPVAESLADATTFGSLSPEIAAAPGQAAGTVELGQARKCKADTNSSRVFKMIRLGQVETLTGIMTPLACDSRLRS